MRWASPKLSVSGGAYGAERHLETAERHLHKMDCRSCPRPRRRLGILCDLFSGALAPYRHCHCGVSVRAGGSARPDYRADSRSRRRGERKSHSKHDRRSPEARRRHHCHSPGPCSAGARGHRCICSTSGSAEHDLEGRGKAGGGHVASSQEPLHFTPGGSRYRIPAVDLLGHQRWDIGDRHDPGTFYSGPRVAAATHQFLRVICHRHTPICHDLQIAP